MSNSKLNQRKLQTLVHYSPLTGKFTCLLDEIQLGKKTSNGYIEVMVGRKKFLAHRLAHLYMTGKHHEGPIDHINGDRADNRWSNLRASTFQQNSANARRSRIDGHQGVTKVARGYMARITHCGTSYVIGVYDSQEVAAEAYRIASRMCNKEFSTYHIDIDPYFMEMFSEKSTPLWFRRLKFIFRKLVDRLWVVFNYKTKRVHGKVQAAPERKPVFIYPLDEKQDLSEDLSEDAVKLLMWFSTTTSSREITLRLIITSGPRRLRDRRRAEYAVRLLLARGLIRVDSAGVITTEGCQKL